MRFLYVFMCSLLFSSCQREIDQSVLDTNFDAEFQFISTAGTCSDISFAGQYVKGQSLTSENKISVKVNVGKAGRWSASTSTANGFGFTGSGEFATAGDQVITLVGTGLPSQDGPATFTIKAGDNLCGFTIVIETSSANTNIPPVANAGEDKTIALPVNHVTLNGIGTDADGSITSYQWTKISGPASVSIETPTQNTTSIVNLVAGTYQFELKVTDNGGAIDKDSVNVIVTAVPTGGAGTLNFQQELFGVIGTLREMMSYNQSGKITYIRSQYRPDRKIYYSGNRISKIEYYYIGSNGQNTERDEVVQFKYDNTGNVIQIDYLDTTTNQPQSPAVTYVYNPDNTLKSRKTYYRGSTDLESSFEYFYTNGNVTSFSDDGEIFAVEYDNRTNNFKDIYPQFYFLDLQNVFEQTYRSEIFFFSMNYPTKISTISIAVSTTSAGKPFEIRFDNELWYRYGYN